jgi:hypothetical protein
MPRQHALHRTHPCLQAPLLQQVRHHHGIALGLPIEQLQRLEPAPPRSGTKPRAAAASPTPPLPSSSASPCFAPSPARGQFAWPPTPARAAREAAGSAPARPSTPPPRRVSRPLPSSPSRPPSTAREGVRITDVWGSVLLSPYTGRRGPSRAVSDRDALAHREALPDPRFRRGVIESEASARRSSERRVPSASRLTLD